MPATDQTVPRCTICGTDVSAGKAFRKDGYTLHHCAECEHWLVHPMPTEEELAKVYSYESNYQVQEKRIFDHAFAATEKMRASKAQIDAFASGGRLLDIGCSSGRFLWLMRDAGWDVTGVELNAGTAEIARHNGFTVHNGTIETADFERESFDVINVGDVIEHVQDPRSFLDAILPYLRPGGLLLVVTPNSAALFPAVTYRLSRLFSIPWSHVTPPYHLNQFSSRSLRKLLKGMGLEVVDERYRPAEWHYELGETHIRRDFKRAFARRDVAGTLKGAYRIGATLAAYGAAYAVDRASVRKKEDLDMRILSRKPA